MRRGFASAATCGIQVLEFRARVSGPRDVVRELRELFPPRSTLRSPAPHAYAATFGVQTEAAPAGREACTITQNGVPIGSSVNPDDVLASLEWAINNAAVEHLSGRYLLFHAGAVAYAQRGILLPAVAGSGKTTLVAGLVAAGFQYLSDDVGAIEPLTGYLAPFAKSLCVKRGSYAVLEELYPQLRHATARRRFGGAPIKYLLPPHPAVASTRVPVGLVILPHYAAASVTALEPITRSETLERLMEQSFSLPAHGVPGMCSVVDMLAGAECYSLTIGNLDEAVALVQGLAMRAAPARSVSSQVVHQTPPLATHANSQHCPSPAPVPAALPSVIATPRVSTTWFRRRLAVVSGIGMALIGIGALVLAYGAALQADILPSAPLTVPRPAALDRPRPPHVKTTLPAVPIPLAGLGSAADTAPEAAGHAVFGWARHLSIATIGVDTDVVPASTQINQQGQLEWQTVPFVAAHYVDTAPVGSPGNAVITGHLATLSEGNVFRELNKIDYGDRVVLTSDYGEFTYVVDELKLVLPIEVSVMDPTTDARLTLITCGGQFDPHTRTFDHRMIVIAKLVDPS